ncbi:MbtH family protein [Actinomadura fibrosa]|uniref:MbtH family protein n=1 Tax=Actinomadura fibrosa TaxID=111802 RepID=A0ABW2Y2C7_9ACTN|nr:MbtH family protein [Actinomadura fibrosa]
MSEVNPFDDEARAFVVLANDEGQHSLWPSSTAVPDGWRVILGESSRQRCLTFVDEHWTDLEPRSLALQRARGTSASKVGARPS